SNTRTKLVSCTIRPSDSRNWPVPVSSVRPSGKQGVTAMLRNSLNSATLTCGRRGRSLPKKSSVRTNASPAKRLPASLFARAAGPVAAGPWELTHTEGGSSAAGAALAGTEAALATSLAEAGSTARTRRTVMTCGGATCGSASMGITSPFVSAEMSHAGTRPTPRRLLSVVYARLGGTDRVGSPRREGTAPAGGSRRPATQAVLPQPPDEQVYAILT